MYMYYVCVAFCGSSVFTNTIFFMGLWQSLATMSNMTFTQTDKNIVKNSEVTRNIFFEGI